MRPQRDPRSDPPRRIAFVITRSDSIGGAQLHVLELARALQDAGHVVRVFVGGEGPYVPRLREAGVPVESIPHLVREINPIAELRALTELRAALRRFEPELITTHSSKASWLGRALASVMRVPVLFTVHGWQFRPGALSPFEQFARLVELATAPLADRIMTVSEYDRDVALEHHVARPEAFRVVHNSLPDNELRADPSAQPPTIVMVARLASPKDPICLIEALAQLRELDWRCELIGDGPDREQVEDALREAELGDRLVMLGTRDDVPARLAAAQLFVLSSRREGFPISILEAMRAGLPVVASDVGGIKEAVVEGETGALVPHSRADALRDALAPLIRDPARRAAMGQAGRRRYEAEFAFEAHLRRAWAVYAEVLEGGSGSLARKLRSRIIGE